MILSGTGIYCFGGQAVAYQVECEEKKGQNAEQNAYRRFSSVKPVGNPNDANKSRNQAENYICGERAGKEGGNARARIRFAQQF